MNLLIESGMFPGFRHIAVRLQAKLAQVRQGGPLVTVVSLVSLVVTGVVWLLLLPVTAVLHLAGFRRLTVIGGRIGHLAAEVDCFLKKKALGEIRQDRRYFLAIPPDKVANERLLDYWRDHLAVISQPWVARMAVSMSRWLLMKERVDHYILRLNETQDIYRVNTAWDGRPPILSLSDEDTQWGAGQLRALGIPDGAWFVCVHVREAGFSPGDDMIHSHRNASIEAVMPAMREIARRGGWCIRMGGPSMSSLPACENAIDYAHHPLRSPRMDVVLCASCRFFFGDTSGLAFVSSAFGVPSALANMIPCSAMGVLPGDLSIPKLHWLESEKRYLRFDEIMSSEVSSYRYAALYESAGIRVDENDPEDIAALAGEMLDRLEGRFAESEHDRDRVRRFGALLHAGHYSYGTSARIAASFLRNHKELLGDDELV